MTLSKETKLCISIASRPSNFGTTLFNELFSSLKLDFIYKAMQLNPDGDLEGAIRGVRALGIRGCAVSMPFKEKVVPFLDRLDETAKQIGAVNTIVNEDGILTGYNTDYSGALEVLKNRCEIKGKYVLVCGLGGAAKAIVLALKNLGAQIWVTGRDEKKSLLFAKTMLCETFPWSRLNEAKGELFVNATSVGMFPNTEESVVSGDVLKNFKAVFDVVGQPLETKLIREARRLGLNAMPGFWMTMEQALRQFELYTGQKAPQEWVEQYVKTKSFRH